MRNRILQGIVLLLSVWVSCGFAVSLLPGKTPVQSYDTNDGGAFHGQSMNATPQGHPIQPSMAANTATTTQPQKPETAGAGFPVAITPNTSSQGSQMTVSTNNSQASSTQAVASYKLDSLTAQIGQLNQLTLMYEQKSNQRFEGLETSNEFLKNKVDQLTQQIHLLNGNLNTLHKLVLQLQHEPNSVMSEQHHLAFWLSLKSWLIANGYHLIIYSVLTVLLIVFIIILFRGNNIKKPKSKKKHSAETAQGEEHDTDAEYDYLGSEEGIVAKLDLARAYLAMDDQQAARRTLQQVLEQGDSQQQQQARDLLGSLASEKK